MVPPRLELDLDLSIRTSACEIPYAWLGNWKDALDLSVYLDDAAPQRSSLSRCGHVLEARRPGVRIGRPPKIS
jgi:hypothetical protein